MNKRAEPHASVYTKHVWYVRIRGCVGGTGALKSSPLQCVRFAWPDLRAPSLHPPARGCIIHLLNLCKIRRRDAGSVFCCEINTGLFGDSGVCVFIMRSLSYAHTVSQSSVAGMSILLSDGTMRCCYLESHTLSPSLIMDATRSILWFVLITNYRVAASSSLERKFSNWHEIFFEWCFKMLFNLILFVSFALIYKFIWIHA